MDSKFKAAEGLAKILAETAACLDHAVSLVRHARNVVNDGDANIREVNATLKAIQDMVVARTQNGREQVQVMIEEANARQIAKMVERHRGANDIRDQRIRDILDGTAGEEARTLMQREEDVQAALDAYTHTMMLPVPDALYDALECHFKLPNDDLTVEEEDELVRLWRAAGSPGRLPDPDEDKDRSRNWCARRVLGIIEEREAMKAAAQAANRARVYDCEHCD